MSFFEQFIGGKEKCFEKEVKIPSFKTPFKIRQLTAREQNNISRKYNISDKDNLDAVGFVSEMIVKSLVYPKMNETDVMQAAEKIYEQRTGIKTKIVNPEHALEAMLWPKEYEMLANEVTNFTAQSKEQYQKDKDFRKEINDD